MEVKVCSTDRDTDYFDIVASALQGNTLAPLLFIICKDHLLTTSIDLMKETVLSWQRKKKPNKNRWYPAQTITDVYYADDIAFIANAPAHVESLLKD